MVGKEVKLFHSSLKDPDNKKLETAHHIIKIVFQLMNLVIMLCLSRYVVNSELKSV